MSLTVIEVSGADFRTTEQADLLNTKFLSYLGFSVRYMPARLALARSLSIKESPAMLKDGFDKGKSIKGDTLFGDGTSIAVWISLVTESNGSEIKDIKMFQDLILRHWKRGIELLHEDWIAAGEDKKKFIRKVIDVAQLSTASGGNKGGLDSSYEEGQQSGKLIVPVGEISIEVNSEDGFLCDLNGPGCSPHIAVMGGVGSGKTRTAVATLKAIRKAVKVPMLAFDFKGDLGTGLGTDNSYRLDTMFEATNVSPPNVPIPLDVLYVADRTDIGLKSAAQKFVDNFKALKAAGFGPKQSKAMFESVLYALKKYPTCTLQDIYKSLQTYYEENDFKEDGAIGAMDEICRFNLFNPTHKPSDFFKKGWIIYLPATMSERQKNIIVNLTLSALESYINGLPDSEVVDGYRSIRHLCLLDEAHRILESKVPSLANLIRQSRSKGGIVMLISQSPDDFDAGTDDFLSEMGVIAAFSTNAKASNAARLLGKGANLSNLGKGECLVKRRGDATGKRVRAWE